MNGSPSAIDALLAEKNMAERMIMKQSSALHGMVKSVQEAEEKMNKLDFKLESPLLGDGLLDSLLEDQIPGALSRTTEQQSDQKPGSEEVYTDTIQQKHTLDRFAKSSEQDAANTTWHPQSDRLTSSASANAPYRKNRADQFASQKMSDTFQKDTDDLKKQRIKMPLKTGKVKLYTVPEPEKKQNSQQQSSSKDRAKSSIGSAVAVEIDAIQARDRMARRVTKAGIAGAWYSPVNLSMQPQQAKQSNEKNRQKSDTSAKTFSDTVSHDLAYAGLKKARLSGTDAAASYIDSKKPARAPVAEQQIENYLKKLIPAKPSYFNATQEKGQKRAATFPEADQPQQSGARQSSEQTMREGQLASQRPHGFPHESTPRAPGMPGGLRGLAAQATGPLEQDTNPAGVGDISSQQNRLLPTHGSNEVINKAAGKSGNALAELAELLADEARRAGIDLEQFRP